MSMVPPILSKAAIVQHGLRIISSDEVYSFDQFKVANSEDV